MRIINKINNELIDIREYANPNVCFNVQLDKNQNLYDFCVFHEQFNPFDLFNDNRIKDKEIERLNNIISELDKLIEQYSKNDYYYKYNGKYLKSEIINDLKELKEKKDE